MFKNISFCCVSVDVSEVEADCKQMNGSDDETLEICLFIFLFCF